MKQVAAAAGVSQATVSLSLANHPRIPDSTRVRVQGVARRLGYNPNPFVAALMRNRRRNRPAPGAPVLALVCPQSRSDAWRNAASRTVRQILEGAIARAAARGYVAEEVWLHRDGMSNERFSDVLRARGIPGIILGPLPPNSPPPALKWEYFSVVRIGVPLHSLPLRAVCHDNYGGAMTAVRECLKLGYRRPGILLLRSQNRNLEHRWESGFLGAVQGLPAARRIPPFVSEDWPSPPELHAWLHLRHPDVLITPGHESIQRSLATLGLRVPADMGVVSLACPDTDPDVSGIGQNGRLIGASAIDMLGDLVERHERGLPQQPVSLMVQGAWNPGQTVRAAAP